MKKIICILSSVLIVFSSAVCAFADDAGPNTFIDELYYADTGSLILFWCSAAALVLALTAAVVMILLNKKKKKANRPTDNTMDPDHTKH